MINYKYYKNNKSKHTILLLHGWGVDSSYLESLNEILKDTYSTLILDLPGHGESSLNKVYTVSDYIDEIFLIIKKEEIESLFGIGHSFGGKLLLAYSLKYPISGCILISPSIIKPKFSLIRFLKIRLYKIFRFLHLKIPKSLKGSRDYLNTSGLKRQTFLNVCSFYFNKKELSKVNTDVVIIGFNEDTEVKVYQNNKLHKYLKGSKLLIYQGNHFSYFSYLKEIKILLSFLVRGK